MARIVITTEHKGKQYRHSYEGEIAIEIDPEIVRIGWFIDEMPPQNEDELCTWRSNGFDMFWNDEVQSIVGE